jgi:hypothetical protein
LLANLQEGVGFASGLRPPDLEVVDQPARADLTEAVGFAEILY